MVDHFVVPHQIPGPAPGWQPICHAGLPLHQLADDRLFHWRFDHLALYSGDPVILDHFAALFRGPLCGLAEVE